MKKIYRIGTIVIVIFITICILFFNKSKSQLKYVFLFIGDGMSTNQVELTEIYLNTLEENSFENQKHLNFTNFPNVGLRKNYDGTNYIPDSASSGTALASGILTYAGSINTDLNGNSVLPITYDLKDQGMKIGIVTTMSLNHATPAAFYAHANSRLDYSEIAHQLVDSNFDYFAGGTIYDNGNNIDYLLDYATKSGYNVVNTEEQLNNIDKNNKNIVVSPITTSEGWLHFANDETSSFNLANYVEKGIDVLNNKNGFFMMIESGLIDYAGHNNDARSVISEIIELEKSVQVALDFYEQHPNETLIIVTGDHETGGLTLGNNTVGQNLNLNYLKNQLSSYQELENYISTIKVNNISFSTVLKYLSQNYGLSLTNSDKIVLSEEELNSLQNAYQEVLEGNEETLKKMVLYILANKSGLSFSTISHTASRMPVYTYGLHSAQFSGVYNSKQFNQILRDITKK